MTQHEVHIEKIRGLINEITGPIREVPGIFDDERAVISLLYAAQLILSGDKLKARECVRSIYMEYFQ